MSPDSWQIVSLGEVLELKRGHDLPKGQRRDGSIPVVSSSGVTGYHNEARASAPGVVTGRYGTLGNVYYLTEPFWPLNTTLYVRDFKGNDPRFVSFLLETIDYWSCSDKGAVPGVNRNHLHELTVSLPNTVGEQRAIASILGALDDKIELNRKMSRTLDEVARTLFRSRFLDGESACDSRAVSSVATINGWTLGKRDALEAIRYIEISAVNEGTVAEIACYRRGEEPSRARRRLRNGDTVISTVRPDRRAYFLALHPADDLLASTGFAVLTSEGVPWSVLHAAMTQPEVFEDFGRLADGGAYPAISAQQVGEYEIPVPNDSQALDDFHEVAAPLYERSAVARDECVTLGELRDALLPKLLSGELRVQDAVSMVEEVV
jgi:type I restriction enzyme S subunit